MLIMGLMSGTSLDGIDCALTSITGSPPNLTVELKAFQCRPYTDAQRRRLTFVCSSEQAGVADVCELNVLTANWFADAVQATLSEVGANASDIDLIASHGQTIHHAVTVAGREPATLQIGDPSVLAQRTGITTVGNFRLADVAAGGQGAPLVAYVDWLLYRSPVEARVLVNLGGIANLTYMPRNACVDDVLACDTGPGNMLIDRFVELMTGGKAKWDQDGNIARQGAVNEDWLCELLTDPFFSLPPPKSTGREQYGQAHADGLWSQAGDRGLAEADRVATVTALTSRSIAGAVRDLLPGTVDRVWLSGGGVHNDTLAAWLQADLAEIPVAPLAEDRCELNAKEAVAFAVLAHETLHGRPGNLPRCTGAVRATILGQLAPGRNFRKLLQTVDPVAT